MRHERVTRHYRKHRETYHYLGHVTLAIIAAWSAEVLGHVILHVYRHTTLG